MPVQLLAVVNILRSRNSVTAVGREHVGSSSNESGQGPVPSCLQVSVPLICRQSSKLQELRLVQESLRRSHQEFSPEPVGVLRDTIDNEVPAVLVFDIVVPFGFRVNLLLVVKLNIVLRNLHDQMLVPENVVGLVGQFGRAVQVGG